MRDSKFYTLFDAVTANGSRALLADDFKHAVFTIVTENGPVTGTIRFVASDQNDIPDFSSASTSTNQWEYIQVVDLQDGASIDGDTGIPYSAAAAETRSVEFNTNAKRWVGAVISGASGGNFTISARLTDNS